MASGTFAWYGPGLKRVIDGEIDFNGHTFKATLLDSTYTPDPDTHDDLSDVIADEVTGTNWAAGGQTLSITTGIDTANNRVYFTATDVSVNSVTLTDGKHLVIWDDTHASDALVGYVTFDTALAPSNGTLTIDFGTEIGRITY